MVKFADMMCDENMSRRCAHRLYGRDFRYFPSFPSLYPSAQNREEIVAEDARQFHQRAGVNPRTGEDEIDVVAVAAQLLCNPRHLDALPRHYLLDVPADMVCAVLHCFLLPFGSGGKNTTFVLRALGSF